MPPRRKNAKARVSRKRAPPDTNQLEISPEEKEMEVDTNLVEENAVPLAHAPATLPVPEDPATDEGKQKGVEDEEPPESNVQQTTTLEERTAKLKLLRERMRQSTTANRKDLLQEANKTKSVAREVARQDKERKLKELLLLKAEAEDRGGDVERSKNWQYTVEENDEWEKRLKRKKTRADFEFHDDAHAARRKYKKDLDFLKPDLEAYNAQKSAALNASSSGDGSQDITVQQQLAVESFYRDANTLLYADNKPTEEAIDRVVSKLNLDLDKRSKRSRKRPNQEDGDITYINERNRVFNKKIARYYDKYTAEIRASFERGTAL